MINKKFVSIHGGHSGEFCNHAENTLEEIIQCYIDFGFNWVGITEHVYPISNKMRYHDEIVCGLDVIQLASRFKQYIKTCRMLQKKYQDKITIFTGCETETYNEQTEHYNGYKEFIPYIIRHFKPDYVVGSVHHIFDHHMDTICIDYSKEYYHQAADALGGVDNLYCRYFDIQYEMIQTIEPAVVGHFDLIRIFDENYHQRIKNPDIWERIIRNLNIIQKKNLIMDFNLRSLTKGASEPYISAPILAEANKMGIAVVIGDDSHGIKDIGVNMLKGIKILEDASSSHEHQAHQAYVNIKKNL